MYTDYRLPMALLIPKPVDRRHLPEMWQQRSPALTDAGYLC